jgi:translation initiation factor 5
MKVNIPKSKTDPTYRYKRDQIDITVQNIKGGITKINNLDVIAKQLCDETSFIIKFLKKKTNTSITDNEKGILINKVEKVDNLEEYLEEFIQKYILCPKCSNPEFTFDKSTRICKACGISRTFV